MWRRQPYSRGVMRSDLGAWLHERWKPLTLGTAVLASLLAIEAFLILRYISDGWAGIFLVGVLTGVGAVGVLWGLHISHLAGSRQSLNMLRGAWGEDFTRDELKKARRRKLVWGWIDGIDLERGDIDHFVATQRAGLLVIDSKWRNQLDARGREELAASSRRLKMRAEGLANSVMKAEAGRHRGRPSRVTVQPVVVLWGSEQKNLRPDDHVEGIPVVAGSKLVDWLRGIETDPLERDVARDVLARIREWDRCRRRIATQGASAR